MSVMGTYTKMFECEPSLRALIFLLQVCTMESNTQGWYIKVHRRLVDYWINIWRKWNIYIYVVVDLLVPGKRFRREKCAATDREDFLINKRCRARQLWCWPRQWNWRPVVDLEMLWIRSIYFDRLRHFVRWPLCKCQRCISIDVKIVVQNLHCTSQGSHFRFQSIAKEEE